MTHSNWAFPKNLIGAICLLAFAWTASADEANEAIEWAQDFPVGTSIPAISAQDQNGNIQTFDDLKGEKGLVLVFSRSFEW